MLTRKLNLPVAAYLAAVAALSFSATVPGQDIAGTSFEEVSTFSGQYVDTADAAVDHPLLNNTEQPQVNFTSTGGELGFSAFYTNTRDDVGLTDGDFAGVTGFTGVVGAFTDGTQGYQISDPDGLMTVTLDTVTLPSVATVKVDLFVQSTGWESTDRIRVWAETPGGPVDLLNTEGSDIDSLGIEGEWLTLTAELSGQATATLKFELDANSSSEAIYVDNVRFVEEGLETVSIMEIQGVGHISPFLLNPLDRDEQLDDFGNLEAYNSVEKVRTRGVVTAVAFNGFYLQDPTGDGDEKTSDGIFVFKFGSKPSVGDEVTVEATVTEFFPGDASTGNLSITQLTGAFFQVEGTGERPTPVVIGSSGRIPPAINVISDDELPVNLQDPIQAALNNFNPDEDGIDFYESLEGMLVKVESPVCVSGLRSFGRFSSEVFTLANSGSDIFPADARTSRGGINLQPDPNNTGDQNPERVQIQFDASLIQDGTLYPDFAPVLNLGDQLGDVTGVVGYSFGNFEVNATELVEVKPAGLEAEVSPLKNGKKKLTVASYNVLNLSAIAKDDNQRQLVASQIVNNLGSPDIIGLQEIQDNNGETNDGTTDASESLQKLVDAIVAEGGPRYQAFDVAPEDGASGGVPGGNIRNAYLFNASRVKLISFESLTEEALTKAGVSEPAAFAGTRDPLVGVFKFRKRRITIINNHLSSRFGSTPVFGGVQPFVQAGEAEREAQIGALNEYVNGLLCKSPFANVIVMGDLNTMEFTNDLTDILPRRLKCNRLFWWLFRNRPILFNLIDTVTTDDVYTFIFEGNSQVLDHMAVTGGLARIAKFDIVHTNVDFFRPDDDFDLDGGGPDGERVGSDHEPLLAVFDFGPKRKKDDDDDDEDEDDEDRDDD